MAPLAAVLGAVRGRASSHVVIRTSLLQVQTLHVTLPSTHGPQRQQSWVQRRGFSSGAGADPDARPPFPPFTFETAKEKVNACEFTERTRGPHSCSSIYRHHPLSL